MSEDYVFITWEQKSNGGVSSNASLLGPQTIDTCGLFTGFYTLNRIQIERFSPNFGIRDNQNIDYFGSGGGGDGTLSKIRVYIQFYFTVKPNGTYTTGVIQSSRTGCRREVTLEIVPCKIFNGYSFIGNAIVNMDGTDVFVDPEFDKSNSWIIFLKAVTGNVPTYSATGKNNICYITFTPYI
jgi:hypothetical protein